MTSSANGKLLFGGDLGWNADDWTASDDRVRGGSSQSFLDCDGRRATFRGTLDTQTLGGAGFASQRTTGDKNEWNLSTFAGIEIELDLLNSDQKEYTLILKDQLLPKNPDNGREQSTISWEYDFKVSSEKFVNKSSSEAATLFAPWAEFKPTYRGKERKDAPAIDLSRIKRFSIMMRSFFGTQEGDFRLTLVSISAIQSSSLFKPSSQGLQMDKEPSPSESTSGSLEPTEKLDSRKGLSILDWLCGRRGRL